MSLTAGRPLEVEISTPAGGSGEFENQFDPTIRVYDAGGNLVAFDDNSASDRRNARRVFHLLDGGAGTYCVEVGSFEATAETTTGGDSLYLVEEPVGGESAAVLVTDLALQTDDYLRG